MSDIREISAALGDRAEELCRRYLPEGRREGSWWLVGDIDGTPGRSLILRLAGPGSERPGWWTDTATGERGDLLDLIRHHHGGDMACALKEARRLLALDPAPLPCPAASCGHASSGPLSPSGRSVAARRLWALCEPLAGSAAEAYLAARGIDRQALGGTAKSLRAHLGLWHRDSGERLTLPGLVAAVRDDAGHIVGVHKTFLDPNQPAKAPVESPRQSRGAVHGIGVRLGKPAPGGDLLVGEGIETVLSLRMAFPHLPAVAALSAGSLAALNLPWTPARLLIAADRDRSRAGLRCARTLMQRVREDGITAVMLIPKGGDFNDDLLTFGPPALAARVQNQLRRRGEKTI